MSNQKSRKDAGVITGNYYEYPALSRSQLANVHKSWRHVRYYEHRDATDYMKFGNFAHAMLLEPEKVKDRFVKMEKPVEFTENGKPANWGYRENKAFKLEVEQSGKVGIEPSDWERAEALVAAIKAGKTPEQAKARDLIFGDGSKQMKIYKELGMWWIDPTTGIKAKIKLDTLVKDVRDKRKAIVINDVKIVEDASEDSFDRKLSSNSESIDLQDPFYSKGISHIFADDIAKGFNLAPFIFTLIENKPPFRCAQYYVPQATSGFLQTWIDDKFAEYAEYLNKEANEAGFIWPGYGDFTRNEQGIKAVDISTYRLRKRYGIEIK